MIWVAYAFVVAAVLWVFLRRGGRHELDKAGEAPVRVVAVALGIAFAIGGLALLVRNGETATAFGKVLLIILTAAAMLYVLGVCLWRGSGARRLRIAGWIGMTCALLVPTTLSLALPFVAILVLTLRSAPAENEGRRPHTKSDSGTAAEGA